MNSSENPVDKLKWIMGQLRDPETGCPWDLKQTFQTVVPCTLEEAYEVADAIERHDMQDLKEELGDLLFQVVFYSQLAKEEGHFEFDAVVEAISEKLIRRHPHVFSTENFETEAEVMVNWEQEKARERSAKACKNTQESVLDNIPQALPSLTRSYKLQKRCAQVGFDWDKPQEALQKVKEEVHEVQEELSLYESEQSETTHQKLEEELGDLFFALVNVARKLKLDPEMTVRKANQKFERRFRGVETALFAKGASPEKSSLVEMDLLWDEIKAQEKLEKKSQ